MKKPKKAPWIVFMLIALSVALSVPATASEIQMISIVELNQLLGKPNVMVVDVRSANDWQTSDIKIQGAVRKAPQNYESWARDLPKDKTLVLY